MRHAAAQRHGGNVPVRESLPQLGTAKGARVSPPNPSLARYDAFWPFPKSGGLVIPKVVL